MIPKRESPQIGLIKNVVFLIAFKNFDVERLCPLSFAYVNCLSKSSMYSLASGHCGC